MASQAKQAANFHPSFTQCKAPSLHRGPSTLLCVRHNTWTPPLPLPMHQQNFQRFPQFVQVTKVVMGSSALRVCIW